MNKEQVLEYLSQYRGLSLFHRAEVISRSRGTMKKELLDYCLEREQKSKLVFKLEESKRVLNYMIEGRPASNRKRPVWPQS